MSYSLKRPTVPQARPRTRVPTMAFPNHFSPIGPVILENCALLLNSSKTTFNSKTTFKFYSQSINTYHKCLLICQADPPDNHNTRSTKIFNILTPKFRLTDYTTSVMCLRGKLKRALLTNQHNHALLDWTVKDFDCTNVIFQKL